MIDEPFELSGTIERQRVAVGSKSERTALVLVTESATVVLRRRGSGAFGAEDGELSARVGELVTVTGNLVGNTFLFTKVG